MTIQVWFNSGEARQPWHVGLHDGVAIAETYNRFSAPIDAMRFASEKAKVEALEVVKPKWLKVVLN